MNTTTITVEEKTARVRAALAEGKHVVDLVVERADKPLLVRGFEDEFGFNLDSCVKRSEFDAISGGGYDYAHLYEKYNKATPLDRPGKRVVKVEEEVIVPGVLKRNLKTGNTSLTMYKVNGEGKKSTHSWTLDGKPFNPGERRFQNYFKSAGKPTPTEDRLRVIKANLATIVSMKVDGKELW